MTSKEKIDELIKSLNCHFYWNLDHTCAIPNRISGNIIDLEEKVLIDMIGNESVECKTYLLLSFAFASKMNSRLMDFEKAFSYIEKAKAQASSKAELFLIAANKLCIRNMKLEIIKPEDIHHVGRLYESLTNVDKSELYVIRAFSLSQLSFAGYAPALKLYREAANLDVSNWEAYFGVGLMLGRLRRFNLGPVCNAETEELDAFRKAMVLNYKHPLPFVFYALCLSSELNKETKVNEMQRYLQNAFSKLDSHGGTSAVVLKWCAKGYRCILKCRCLNKKERDDTNIRLKTCIERALELHPKNTSILHEAGICYWRCKGMENLKKAKEYLKQASEYSVSNTNMYAELDLIQLGKQLLEEDHNVLNEYSKLLIQYRDHPEYLALINIRIGDEYGELNEDFHAGSYYLKALELSPHSRHVQQVGGKYKTLAEKFLNSVSENCSNHELSEDKKAECKGNFLKVIKIYNAIKPIDYKQIRTTYEMWLDLFPEDGEASTGYLQALLHLGEYDKCIEWNKTNISTTQREILAEAHFKKAELFTIPDEPLTPDTCSFPEAIELYCKSAELGHYEAAIKYLNFIEGSVLSSNPNYRFAVQWIERLVVISLNQPELKYNGSNPKDIFYPKDERIYSLNMYRFEMTHSKSRDLTQVTGKAKDVIIEAKSVLDGTFRALITSTFNRSPKQKEFYFPYLYRRKHDKKHGEPTDSSLMIAKALMVEKVKTMGVEPGAFQQKLSGLLEFLARRTPIYDADQYTFVAEFMQLRNEHSHEADITDRDLYELAHQAAQFAAEVVLEMETYMSRRES